MKESKLFTTLDESINNPTDALMEDIGQSFGPPASDNTNTVTPELVAEIKNIADVCRAYLYGKPEKIYVSIGNAEDPLYNIAWVKVSRNEITCRFEIGAGDRIQTLCISSQAQGLQPTFQKDQYSSLLTMTLSLAGADQLASLERDNNTVIAFIRNYIK